MAKTKKTLPLAPLERILRKAGAKRVSKSALVEFSYVITDYASKLSSEAAVLAKHAGRKTVIDSDVRLAKKKFS
jgi:histone H3/H4